MSRALASVGRWPAITALAAALVCMAGCADEPSGPAPNVLPGEPAIISEGPATLAVPAGDHRSVEGRGPAGFRVDIEIDRDDAVVEVEAGESIISSAVTISHDQAGPIPIASSDDIADPFATLTLSFDPSLIPPGEALTPLSVLVVARYPTETETLEGPTFDEMATARTIGSVDPEAGTIEVDISVLPERMDLAVVHAPDMVAISEVVDEEAMMGLTPNPPWPTGAVWAIYPEAPADRDCTLSEHDRNVACRLRRLAEQVEGSGDAASIHRVVFQRVMTPAFAVLRTYNDLGLRRPHIQFFTPAGQDRLHAVLYVGWGASRYILSGPFPQLNVEMRAVESDGSDPAIGTVKTHLFHEMLHAVVEGYDIASVHVGDVRSLRGFNEGLAMVFENTCDSGTNVAQVRSGKDYAVYRLDMPLGSYETPYANDDFFAYLFRRFLNNDLGFLAGDEGLLESLRSYSNQAGLASGEDYRLAYLSGLDAALRTATSHATTLHDAFDRFVRNRFYEHDDESRLRSDDTHPVHTGVVERFSSSDYLQIVTVTDGMSITIPSDAAPAWGLTRDFKSMSAALVVFEAGTESGGSVFEGELDLVFSAEGAQLGPEGLRVTLYPDGEGGISLSGDRFTDGSFGERHRRLYALAVNTSLDDLAALTIQATTGGGAEDTGSLAVTVQQSTSGGGIAGATVELRDNGDTVIASGTTNTAGQRTFSNVAPGHYSVRVEAAGFAPATSEVDVVAGETAQLAVRLDTQSEGFNVRLFGRITVVDRLEPNNLSPAGIQVTAFDESWAEVGSATLDDSGDYDITFRSDFALAHARGSDPYNVDGFNVFYITRAEREGLATWTALTPVIVAPSSLITGEPAGNSTGATMRPVNPDCTTDAERFELMGYGEVDFPDDPSVASGELSLMHPSAASYCVSGSAGAPTFGWETGRVNTSMEDTWFQVRELIDGNYEPIYTVVGHPNQQPITYGTPGDDVTSDLPAPPLRADGTRYDIRFSAMPMGQAFYVR